MDIEKLRRTYAQTLADLDATDPRDCMGRDYHSLRLWLIEQQLSRAPGLDEGARAAGPVIAGHFSDNSSSS